MSSSQPVFKDMKQSCLREVNSRQDFATFKPPIENDPGCDEIGKQAAGAVAAAKILGDYFTAINSLASFGTTKVGSDAKDLANKTGAALGEKSPAQTAIGAIAQFLVTAATSGYQRRSLEKDHAGQRQCD